MDGDAIGGHVNLITKNAFDYDGQFMEAKVARVQALYGKNGSMGALLMVISSWMAISG